jgi:hypothetical protein
VRRLLVLFLTTACNDHVESVALHECAAADAIAQLHALDGAMLASDGSAAAAATLAIEHDLASVFTGPRTCSPRVVPPNESVTSSCMPNACSFTVTWTDGRTSYKAEGNALRAVGRVQLSLRTSPTTEDLRGYLRLWAPLPIPVIGGAESGDSVVNERKFSWEDVEVDANGCPLDGTFAGTWLFVNHSNYPDYGQEGSVSFRAPCAR